VWGKRIAANLLAAPAGYTGRGLVMPKGQRGGANNIRAHVCPDGETRRIEPVYLRDDTRSRASEP